MRIAALGQLGVPRRTALAALPPAQADQTLVQLDQVSEQLDEAERAIDRAEEAGFGDVVVENLRTRLSALTGRYRELADAVTFLEAGASFDAWVERARTLLTDAIALRKGINAKLSAETPTRNWKIVGATLGVLLFVGGGFYWLSRRP